MIRIETVREKSLQDILGPEIRPISPQQIDLSRIRLI